MADSGYTLRAGSGSVALYLHKGNWQAGNKAVQGIRWDGNKLIVPKTIVQAEASSWTIYGASTLNASWEAQKRSDKKTTQNLSVRAWRSDYLSADSSHAKPRSGRLAGGLTFNVLIDFDQGSTCVYNSWSFSDGTTEIVEYGGTLYKNWDAAKGSGENIGTLSAAGEVSINDPAVKFQSLKVTGGVVRLPQVKIFSYAGRTPAAPVKPESFTVYANNGDIVGRSNAEGNIEGGITGKIDYETGFYEITRTAGFYPEELRYNAVTQDNLPLDSSIIGIDAVRLPADGKIVSLITFAPEAAQSDLQVLTATANGYGKRTPIADYSRKNKGGQGNIAINTGERNGDLVAATLVGETDDLMLITSGGVLIRTKVEQIRETGRAAAGVRLINLDEGETLVSLERVAEETEDENPEVENPEDNEAENAVSDTEGGEA